MTTKALLGIDVGTQSSRVVLLDLDGRILASCSRPLDLETPRPGWAQQDPQVWWETTAQNIRDVLKESGQPPESLIGVGVSGQMHGTVPIGPGGELLSHGVQLWCDKRSAAIVEDFKKGPNVEQASLIAGNPPSAAWFGFKIKWVQVNEPEVYQRAWKFLVPKDWINFRLTGSAAIDYSEASGSFLMDAAREAWSPELASCVGIDMDKLPALYASSAVIGRVTGEAASQTGLAQGTPVVAGGGDMLCGLLAAGITEPGIACDITGTASHLSVYASAPVRDRRLMNLHHVMPGWIPFGIIDSAGGALKWFKDTFCKEEIERGSQVDRSPYALLDDYAAEVEPGGEGLLYYPYMLGERALGTPYARGVLFGLTPRVGKGAIARAIMEGVALELRRPLELIELAGNPVREVRFTGGGAQSKLWAQINADVLQKRCVTFETYEGSIHGAAILAGVGAGVYADERVGVQRLIRLGASYEPNRALQARYDYLFDLFKDLHDRMQEPFNRLANLP